MGQQHELGVESTATILHHPIHPLLVPFPIASFVGAFVTDIVFLASKGHFWSHASYWLLIVGIVTGLAAGAAGAADYLTISSVRRLKTAHAHAIGNSGVIVLAVINLAIRWSDQEAQIAGWGIVLSALTVGLLSITGWLGGSLSYKYHVGAVSPAHGGIVPQRDSDLHNYAMRSASDVAARRKSNLVEQEAPAE